jgi:hypothetical protein
MRTINGKVIRNAAVEFRFIALRKLVRLLRGCVVPTRVG